MLAIGLGVVLIALAVIHPWASGGPDSSARDPAEQSPAAIAQGQQNHGAPAYDASGLYPQCYPITGWRVASLQQQAVFKVRTAWPVVTAALRSAAEVNIPTVYGSGVEAIGFCTPGSDSLTRAQYVGDVSLWRQTPSGAVVAVANAGVLDPQLAAQGEVYLTPPASISANGTWPPGDYFFEVRQRGSGPGTNSASSRWLAMRLVLQNTSGMPKGTPHPRSGLQFMHSE